MLGQTISHYEITDKLGEGGMGVVYKARDLVLDRIVALKFLSADLHLTRHDTGNLLREARVASGLDHPNIGVIYGFEESADHQLFIVMGYYDGETLARKISSALLPFCQAVDLAVQVARGLAAAHARNIVHRDLKPSNIIVTKERVAKIVDFGLARFLASSSVTQTMQVAGTLAYMAPEQLLAEPLNFRCDLWALGVILAQMTTGLHPFLRDSAAATTFAILNQSPAGIDALPLPLRPIAYRALAKLPEHRYPSAKAMLGDLEAAHKQITATTPPNETEESTIIPAQLKQYAERASSSAWSKSARPRPFRWLYSFVATAAVLTILSLTPPIRQRLAALISAPTRVHIAVLPFDTAGNESGNDVLAAGLTDALTGELSNLDSGKGTLWVVPSSIVRNSKVNDPVSAAKRFGVNLVVEGTVQRSDQDLHLQINLIDARSLRQIGSVALEDRTGDLSALQSQAVSQLVSLMHLDIASDSFAATNGHASPAAYELYLQALGYLQRYDKPGNLERAISALNDSVKMDPQFALGFASLGESYRLKNQVDPNPQWITQALANLHRAVQINDRLAPPSVSLASLHSSVGQNDLALQEFQKALAINPRDADAIGGIAIVYEHMGRVQDAEVNFKRAAALRPDYWDGYNSLGWFYLRQRRIPDAINEFHRVIELTPDNATAYSNLAGAYLELNDSPSQAQAESALKRSLEISPSYAVYANLGRLYLSQKRYDDSVRMTRKALELNDQNYAVWDNLRLAYKSLGDESDVAKARAKTLPLLQAYVGFHLEDASAHSLLAILYAEDKNHDRAQRQIDAALALQPSDPSVFADVAEAYEELGDRKDAIAWAQRSLQKGDGRDDLQTRPALQQLLTDSGFLRSIQTKH